MGKILKFCNSCEEGFAERFTFCPVCGASLQAVQLNPVEPEEAVEAKAALPVEEPLAPAFLAEEANEAAFTSPVIEPSRDEAEFASAPTEEIPAVIDEPTVDETVSEDEPAEAPAYMTSPGVLFESEPKYADEVRHKLPDPILSKDEDGYSITVIEEKNSKQRNTLLLGATVLTIFTMVMAWGISLFQKDLDVGSIGDDRSIAMLLDDVPMPVEEIEEKKDDDEGGGGGGGGREDEQEVNQGDLAPQTKDPIRPPDAKVPRLDNPELVMPPPSTEGNQKPEQKYDRWGDPNKYGQIASNGPGTGGGMGSGTGTGQGSGTGTGAGSGSGSGYGGGIGTGTGDGRGGGDGPPGKVEAKVTSPLRITHKQKAQYTDAARTNNVQGTVTLRVTFLASGGIGSITTVKGLPYGLTEQAIAAARSMKFEPQLVNGRPQTTTRPVSFTFNIY